MKGNIRVVGISIGNCLKKNNGKSNYLRFTLWEIILISPLPLHWLHLIELFGDNRI